VGDALRGSGADVAVVDVGPNPLGLLQAWGPDDDVVLVDAVRSGAPPGTVHRFAGDASALVPEPPPGSTHGITLAAVLALARTLGTAPARLRIVGIEGADFTAGGAVHPAVRRAVADVAAAILRDHGAVRRAAGNPPSALTREQQRVEQPAGQQARQ